MKAVLYQLVFLFLTLSGSHVYSQNIRINGSVKDQTNGEPLPGASVYLLSTDKGTISDDEGYFSLSAPMGNNILVVSYVGYVSDSVSIEPEAGETIMLEITLKRDLLAFGDAVVVTGSRTYPRSLSTSPVPVDQFSSPVLENTGRFDLSQSLNVLAPSFYSTRLTYSDATDHMDPATLRSLNPDQTLILVNGKRHHPSSVVNVLSVVGRGAVINDLNTIPASAIKRVEVLRDGASAQYGSDAIAGVINVVLKDDSSGMKIRTRAGQYYEGDGLTENFSANYGVGLGRKGGFVNLTTEFTKRQSTNRAGIYQGLIYRSPGEDGLSFEENLEIDNQILSSRGLSREDFRLQLGNSAMSNANLYYNSSLPLSGGAEFYSFGGLNYRFSRSAGDYRLPNDTDRSNLTVYPNGFLPEIGARLKDKFFSAGIRGQLAGWDADFSHTFGSNSMDFYVENSLNASMGEDSPTSFESGGLFFSQNTSNLDIRRRFEDFWFLHAMGVAAGSELRVENYRIRAGEEASYINEDQVHYPGAQGFPGYQPVDETDRSRYNIGFYLETAVDFTPSFLIEIAGRYEDYSDFGDRWSGKIASRFILWEDLTLRGSVSTGFRAPSMHQKYYSNTGSYYFSGYLFEIMTAPNHSRLAKAFGIPELEEETSLSYSIGMAYKPFIGSTFTIDAYQVDVNDRVILSSTFYSFYEGVGDLLTDFPTVGGVQFFTNGIDTRSRGIDLVFSQRINLYRSSMAINVAVNLNETKVTGTGNPSEELSGTDLSGLLFDRQSRALIELAQPKSKIHGGITYYFSDFILSLKSTRFGSVSYRGINEDPAEIEKDQDYPARWITDFRMKYMLSHHLGFSLGANNLFDVYPDKNNEALQNSGRFPYNTAVTQFGFNGGFYYAGLELNF